MPRKKPRVPLNDTPVDCFAYRVGAGRRPKCSALSLPYCLIEDKPCPFKKNALQAVRNRRAAARRLDQLGLLEPCRDKYGYSYDDDILYSGD